MNNVLKTSLLTLILACGLAAPASAQTKIATVDLRKVFDNFYKTKQGTVALQVNAGDLDKSHKEMLDSLTKANEEAKRLLGIVNDLAISDEEREKRKKTAEDKIVEVRQMEQGIKEFEVQARENLESQKRRMRDRVLEEVVLVINGLARTENYDLVLDIAAESINSTRIVLFSTGATDLTGKVLAKLNADAPSVISGPDEKQDDPKAKEAPKSEKK